MPHIGFKPRAVTTVPRPGSLALSSHAGDGQIRRHAVFLQSREETGNVFGDALLPIADANDRRRAGGKGHVDGCVGQSHHAAPQNQQNVLWVDGEESIPAIVALLSGHHHVARLPGGDGSELRAAPHARRAAGHRLEEGAVVESPESARGANGSTGSSRR
jgi:hypothetical protein